MGEALLLEANIMSLTTRVCSPCPVQSLHSDHKPLSPPPCPHQVGGSFWAPCMPQSPYGNPDHGLWSFNLSFFHCLTSSSPDLPSHAGGLLEPGTSFSLPLPSHTHTHTHTPKFKEISTENFPILIKLQPTDPRISTKLKHKKN